MVTGLFLLVGLPACTPTCDKVCTKLLDCEVLDTENSPKTECVLECKLHENTYNELDDADTDTGLDESFDALKSCIMDETCDNLAEGSCHDPDLYSW